MRCLGSGEWVFVGTLRRQGAIEKGVCRPVRLRLLFWLLLLSLLPVQPGFAQKVRATGDLRSTLASEYEALAAGTAKGSTAAGEVGDGGPPQIRRVWAWLMAYALRPEPSFLLEVADAIEASEPDKAWMLYSRFLRLRPNSWQRENVERRLRSLMERLVGDLRDESQREALIERTLRDAETATVQGALRDAEGRLGLAYALGGDQPEALASLARLQRRQQRHKEEYVLWKRVQDECDSSSAAISLRSEAELRLSDLTRAPRSMNEPYVAAQAGLYLGGRRLRYQGRVPIETPGGEPSCGLLLDAALGRYRQSRCPSYEAPLAPGMFASLQVFPLAATGPRHLRGLGLRTDVQLAPGQTVCTKGSTDGSCEASHTLRLESGLLWEYRQRPQGESLRAQLSLGYGYHALFLPRQVMADRWRSLQDPTYHTLSVGGELLWPVPVASPLPWSLGLGLHYHGVLSHGALSEQAAEHYGPIAAAHGLRAEVTPLRLRGYQGLVFALSGQLELFQTSFTNSDEAAARSAASNDGPVQHGTATSIVDLQYGLRVGVHYQY